MPTVAASIAELIDLLAGAAHLDGDRSGRRRRGGPARPGHPRSRLDVAPSRRTPQRVEVARWLVWEVSQELGARSASIQDLYVARGRGEVGGFTVPAINIRVQTFDTAPDGLRDGRGGGRGRGHPRARPERADLHLPAPGRVRDQRPRRGRRGRLARPGLRPGRPLPVQRREVRRRPGEDDRGDPARPAARRSRSVTATSTSTARPWSTCPSRASISSSARTTSGQPS